MRMIEKIIKHRIVSGVCFAAFFVVCAGFLMAYLGLREIGSGPLVIHFNDMSGITKVGDIWDIILIGIWGIVITSINFFIAIELEERERFLGKVVAGASLVFAVLLFISFAAILNIN